MKLRGSLGTIKDELLPVQGQFAFLQKRATVFEQDTCNARGPLQELFCCYQHAFNHVVERLSGGEVGLDAGRVAAVNRAECKIRHFYGRPCFFNE